MRYLWTEDTGAGFHFWKLVNQLFFDNELVVESKGSNQGLLDAVLDIDIKDDDSYYVAFDYVVDNQDIRNKYRILKSIADVETDSVSNCFYTAIGKRPSKSRGERIRCNP